MDPKNPLYRGKRDPLRGILDETSLAQELSKAISGSDCPSRGDLEALARRGLDEATTNDLKNHLQACGRCRSKMEGIVESVEAPPASAPARSRPEGQGFARSGSFRLSRPEEAPPPKSRKPLWCGLFLAGAALFAFAAWHFLGDFPYSCRVVQAEGESILRRNQPFTVELRTPHPVYLIEILIHGDGKIKSRIVPGPREGWFENGDQLKVQSSIVGELDLYLVLCPADEGAPERTYTALMQFIQTERAVSRQNQRLGIEVAIGFHHVSFLHEIFRIQQ